MSYNKIHQNPAKLDDIKTGLLVLIFNLGLLISNVYCLLVEPNIFNFILSVIPAIGVYILFDCLFIKIINWYIMKYFI